MKIEIEFTEEDIRALKYYDLTPHYNGAQEAMSVLTSKLLKAIEKHILDIYKLEDT